jgi:tetratricopeptide (TPR) repeat protein
MSSYKKYLILPFSLFALYGCISNNQTTSAIESKHTQDKIKIIENETTYESENLDILLALEYQQQHNFVKSSYYYEKLYNKTNKSEYLIELMLDLYELKEDERIISLAKKNINKHPNIKDKLYKFMAQAYINTKQFKKALEISNKLEDKKSSNYYSLLARIYYLDKQYEKAYKYTKKVLDIKHDTNTVLSATEILYKKLNRTNEAISLLEDYAKKYKCSMAICSNLLFMYNKQNDIDGTIKMLRKIYDNFKAQNNSAGVKQSSNMLVQYLEQKNEKLAMIFLEKEHTNDVKLLYLYKKNNMVDKAIELMNKLYLETSDINMIAQIAIYEFESAKDKQKVLPSVISKFKDVLALVDNATYQNYLGYILIDYDVDVKEGMKLVQLALQKDSKNIAYIDSLAWAQYKLNMCSKAYKNMKKVVDEVGLKDEEIILHWNKIRGCNHK